VTRLRRTSLEELSCAARFLRPTRRCLRAYAVSPGDTATGAAIVSEQGKEYASFIEKQLQAEEARRSSVVTRGGAAVASAAGLVTLVLAVFAVFLGKDFQASGFVAIALGVAVLALLASALCGVVIISPWKYGYAEVDSLRDLTGSQWGTSEEDARNTTANANIGTLQTLKSGTDTQVVWLTAAGVSQLIAVAALAVATVAVLACPESQIQRARHALVSFATVMGPLVCHQLGTTCSAQRAMVVGIFGAVN
jgi:hypothetical protein